MDSLYKKFITDKFRLDRTDVYGLQHRLSDLCFPRNYIHCGQPAGPPPYQYLCGSCAESLILAPRQKLEFDKKYILIDDVFTTGATANACAQILSKAGVSSIELITFGHR